MKKVELHLSKTRLKDEELVSKLQGFLMAQISPDFATFLHEQETNPYSMNLSSTRDESVWVVNLLSEEAEQQMLAPLLNLETIKLESCAEEILVKKVEIHSLSQQTLLDIYQDDDASHLIRVHFYTPTTFKRQGQFVLFPDSRLVEGRAEIEEETLQFLADHSQITSYHLKSHYFPIHGRKYPAFEGRVTIQIKGASTLKAYAQMLLRFGEYAGVGTKCSLGMGGMRIEERKG